MYSYSVELDFDDTRAYTHGLCKLEGVKRVEWWAGMAAPFDFISTAAGLMLTLDNSDGRYSQHKPSAAYYGKLRPGKLIRVRVTYGSTTVTMTELRIADNRQSSLATIDFDEQPEVRLECTDRMSELLAYDYLAPLQQNVRIDEALLEVHKQARVPWPNEQSYFYIDVDSIDGSRKLYNTDDTDFDEARTTLEFVGDQMGRDKKGGTAQQLVRAILPGEVYGLYYFQPRNGTYIFKNRLHGNLAAVEATIFEKDIVRVGVQNGLNPFGPGPLNDLELRYEPRKIGTAASVIYASENLPMRLAARSTRIVRGRYRDPDNPGEATAAQNVIPLTRDVDFIGNSKADGTGEDWTKYVLVSDKAGATDIEIKLFVRKEGDPVFLTKLQARGTPLTTYNKESVYSRDGLSIYDFGHHHADTDTPVTDEELAQRIADLFVNTFKTPSLVITRLGLRVQPDTAAYIQTLTMASKVSVRNEDGTHNKDYIIVGEAHTVDINNGTHDVTYTLRAADTTKLFMIDSSSIDGPHVMDI